MRLLQLVKSIPSRLVFLARAYVMTARWNPAAIFAGMVVTIMGFFFYFGMEWMNWDLARWMGAGFPGLFCYPAYIGCVGYEHWSEPWDYHFGGGILGFMLVLMGGLISAYYVAKGIFTQWGWRDARIV